MGNLKKITGAKVAVHKDDEDYIKEEKEPQEPFVSKIFIKLLKMIFRPKTVRPDILLKDNNEIGGYRVIHTPGSICLYNKNNKVFFL